jgi:hypothetical protein
MSITRRAVLQGAILGACSLRVWPASRLRPGERLTVEQVIFDARRYHALAFAAAAQRHGASARAFCGDVAQAESHDLFAGLRTRKTAVAGLTDFPSLFLLQAMAADAGLRPILRIHHRTPGGVPVHETFGAHALRAFCESRFARCGDHWANEAAHVVLNLPAPEVGAPSYADNLKEANLRVLASRALVTWVMA